mgnify:CR=1 FL=1
MAYSDAQKEATARYNKKAYDFISVVVPKGKRKRIAEYAASQGKSMNRFINDAIRRKSRKSKIPVSPLENRRSGMFFCKRSGNCARFIVN